MKRIIHIAAIAAVALLMSGCKGRTTENVEPDGSPAQEVVIAETGSATETRDSLRKKVEKVAPPRQTPSPAPGNPSAGNSDKEEQKDSAAKENPFARYNIK